MKRSKYFIPTLKEKPNDIEQIGQVYMFRSGMLKKVSNGFFVYLPLMQRVFKKVSEAIKAEMEAADCVECKFPILVSKETLEASGRWNAFGKEMFKLKDRSDNDFAISPTNEEAACFVAHNYVKSYKDLPFSLYQMQQKHRDEISPRNGVMRTREFIMKDAYSFHASEACLDEYYNRMRAAYLNVFKSLKLDVVAVKADTGAMGGSGSEEIMAISADGETDICRCVQCGYAANSEAVATVLPQGVTIVKAKKPKANQDVTYKKEHTPRVKTIDELVAFFNKNKTDFCKAVVFNADGKLVVAFVRGDREVNDVKLKKLVNANDLEIADAAMIAKSNKTAVGFVGPIGLKGIKMYADFEVAAMQNFIVGANEKDYHFTGVNVTDLIGVEYVDLRFADSSDACPDCGADLEFAKATELGHIFKLGKRYTDKLNMQYVTREGGFATPIMGCYGIGVERTIASIVDQHHDEKGICWPVHIAPFAVNIVTVDITNQQQMQVSESIYKALQAKGIEVMWDETDARAGSKFADSDLIGYPLRVVVGRGVAEGKVEFAVRKSGEKFDVPTADAVDRLLELLKS